MLSGPCWFKSHNSFMQAAGKCALNSIRPWSYNNVVQYGGGGGGRKGGGRGVL